LRGAFQCFLRHLMNRAAWKRNDFSVSRPVRETLAFNALHSKRRTFPIVHTEGNAVIVAEIKFREIAMQMLLIAMLIDAAHTALEDREVAFGRVGMHIVADVFAAGMMHRFVIGKVLV
jgi:hypothetical protein